MILYVTPTTASIYNKRGWVFEVVKHLQTESHTCCGSFLHTLKGLESGI